MDHSTALVQSSLNLTAVLSISCFELTVVPQSTNTNMPKTIRQRSGSAAGLNVHSSWMESLEQDSAYFHINDIDKDNHLNCQLLHLYISCKTLHNSYFWHFPLAVNKLRVPSLWQTGRCCWGGAHLFVIICGVTPCYQARWYSLNSRIPASLSQH